MQDPHNHGNGNYENPIRAALDRIFGNKDRQVSHSVYHQH